MCWCEREGGFCAIYVCKEGNTEIEKESQRRERREKNLLFCEGKKEGSMPRGAAKLVAEPNLPKKVRVHEGREPEHLQSQSRTG